MTNSILWWCLGVFIGAIIYSLLVYYSPKPQEKTKLLQATTDNRGLTSIIYKQGNDTLALDYLNDNQLDSLLSIGR